MLLLPKTLLFPTDRRGDYQTFTVWEYILQRCNAIYGTLITRIKRISTDFMIMSLTQLQCKIASLKLAMTSQKRHCEKWRMNDEAIYLNNLIAAKGCGMNNFR